MLKQLTNNKLVNKYTGQQKYNHLVFVINDAGRELYSSYPKEKNDCSVRALCNAFYEATHQEQFLQYDFYHEIVKRKAKRKYRDRIRTPEFVRALNETAKLTGVRFDKYSFHGKAMKGKKKVKLSEFTKLFNHGIYIVLIHEHITCVINGQVHDLKTFWDEYVYVAYRLEENNAVVSSILSKKIIVNS